MQALIFSYNWCGPLEWNRLTGDGGIVVSMVAFQAVDPGSIPGHRILFASPFSLSSFPNTPLIPLYNNQ